MSLSETNVAGIGQLIAKFSSKGWIVDSVDGSYRLDSKYVIVESSSRA